MQAPPIVALVSEARRRISLISWSPLEHVPHRVRMVLQGGGCLYAGDLPMLLWLRCA
jgi:hypothetical protein